MLFDNARNFLIRALDATNPVEIKNLTVHAFNELAQELKDLEQRVETLERRLKG